MTYILDMMLIKMSIGFFLLRLSVETYYNWMIYISLAIVFIWSLVTGFWNLFQCSPVRAQWDFTVPNSKCVNPDQLVAAAYAFSVMTILSDWFYVSADPIVLKRALRLTLRLRV